MSRETSADARASMELQSQTDRDMVLLTFRRRGPMTADECAESIGWSEPYRARRRVSELAKSGLIQASGEVRQNASGRHATVWMVVHRKTQTQSEMFTELRGDILPRRRTR